MVPSHLLARFVAVYRKKGLLQSIIKIFEHIQRLLFRKFDVIFLFNIFNIDNGYSKLPPDIQVESIKKESDILEKDMKCLAENNVNMTIMKRYMNERFSKKCELWFLKNNNDLLGYMWIAYGNSFDNLFPISSDDVYFVDIRIFEQYRGKNWFGVFMRRILWEQKMLGKTRGYYTVHEWNDPMLRATLKFCAKRLGLVRKFHFLGKEFVEWRLIESFN